MLRVKSTTRIGETAGLRKGTSTKAHGPYIEKFRSLCTTCMKHDREVQLQMYFRFSVGCVWSVCSTSGGVYVGRRRPFVRVFGFGDSVFLSVSLFLLFIPLQLFSHPLIPHSALFLSFTHHCNLSTRVFVPLLPLFHMSWGLVHTTSYSSQPTLPSGWPEAASSLLFGGPRLRSSS